MPVFLGSWCGYRIHYIRSKFLRSIASSQQKKGGFLLILAPAWFGSVRAWTGTLGGIARVGMMMITDLVPPSASLPASPKSVIVKKI